jgi:hypothetical protein
MDKGETRDLATLRVHGISSAATPDGRYAIVFQLQDRSIALEVDEKSLADLREQIAVLDPFARLKAGWA